MNKNRTLAQDILPRLLAVSLCLGLLFLFTFLLDTHTRKLWLKTAEKNVAMAAATTQAWLKSKGAMGLGLSADPRIATFLGGNSTEENPRRALYEFSYLNKIKNIYLFKNGSGNPVLHTASAPKLSAETKGLLQNALSTEGNLLDFTHLGGEDSLLVISPVSFQGTPVGAVVIFQPLRDAIRKLQFNLRKILGPQRASLFLLEQSSVKILADISRRVPSPTSYFPTRNELPVFSGRKISGVFEGPNMGGAEIIAALATVPEFPSWRVSAFRPAAELAKENEIFHILAWFGFIVLALVCLLLPFGHNSLVRHIAGEGAGKSGKVGHIGQTAATKTATPRSTQAPRQHLDDLSEKKKTEFQKMADKKLEKIPPSEAEVVYCIRQCLRNRNMKFLYQPVVDGATGVPVMYEIFLRLLDEDGEVLSPALIFPAAEKNNLSSAIDAGVVSLAVERHLTNNKLATPLAINLTGHTFESINFLQTLVDTLQKRNSKGSLLVFELRSRELIEDKEAMHFIRQCRNIGCRFSIDYFGGGTKTLEAAKTMKFDYVKLDAFSFDQGNDPEKVATLTELAEKALSLDLPLVMEKIETQHMAELCKQLKIPYMQGYYIGKPQDDF